MTQRRQAAVGSHGPTRFLSARTGCQNAYAKSVGPFGADSKWRPDVLVRSAALASSGASVKVVDQRCHGVGDLSGRLLVVCHPLGYLM